MSKASLKYFAVPPPLVHTTPELTGKLTGCVPDLVEAAQREPSRSKALLQPYMTLEGNGGAIHTRALIRSFDDFLSTSDTPAVFQNNTPANFRRALTREIGQPESPSAKPWDPRLRNRSAHWRRLCESLEGFDDLVGSEKVALTDLVNRLGYYQVTVDLIDEVLLNNMVAAKEKSDLMSILAIAKLKCGYGEQQAAELLADASDLCGEKANDKAALEIYLTVHHGKNGGQSSDLERHSERAIAAFRKQTRAPDRDDPLFESIFLRGLAFVPFNKKEFEEAENMLDAAQRAAYRALGDSRIDRLAAEENLFALLETRIKEALGKHSFETALHRAEQLVLLDPQDPRSHLHLGEVYLASGVLSPARASFEEAVRTGAPYTARSLFMLGTTLDKLGDMDLAMAVQVAVLLLEPAAVSAALHLRRMALKDNRTALVRILDEHVSNMRSHLSKQIVA